MNIQFSGSLCDHGSMRSPMWSWEHEKLSCSDMRYHFYNKLCIHKQEYGHSHENMTAPFFFWSFFRVVALHIHKAFKQMIRLFHC